MIHSLYTMACSLYIQQKGSSKNTEQVMKQIRDYMGKGQNNLVQQCILCLFDPFLVILYSTTIIGLDYMLSSNLYTDCLSWYYYFNHGVKLIKK